MSRRDALDPQTVELVRLAASLAEGDEPDVRERLAIGRAAEVPAPWVEELMLQTYLMCGFPRMLVGLRLFREIWRTPPGDGDASQDEAWREWVERGEATCRDVYGEHYDALRRNMRALHPAADQWMIVDGYGKVLSRPALDLRRRELCIVAQVALLDAPRQLRSHLHGALAAGATPDEVATVLSIVNPMVSAFHWKRIKEVWRRVLERESDS